MSKNAPGAANASPDNKPSTTFAEDGANAGKPSVAPLFTDYAIEQFTDWLLQFPDPDAVLEQAGLDRSDLRRMEGDDEITAALETREAAVKSTPWRLEPGSGSDFDFVYEQVKAHFEQVVEGAWKAVPYGYSVQEITYRREGRLIAWENIATRPFEWFSPRPWSQRPEDQAAIYAVEQLGLAKPACALSYFPVSGKAGRTGENVHGTRPGKFFCTRRRAEDSRNPMGEALLSRLYWPWFFRTNGWKFWAKFLERFGAPLLIGKTSNNTGEMATALARALQSAVAAVGANDSVEAIAPNNAGDAFERYGQAVDRRIQKVVLGQTLTTDTNGKGSYALGKVHDAVRDDRRMADVRMITGTMQGMIDTILVLNGKKAGAVKFVMEDETGLQPERAERDAKLATAKIVKFTPDYLLRAYDFEEGDFEIPSDTGGSGTNPGNGGTGPGNPGTPPPKGGTKAALTFSEGSRKFTPAQQAVEDLADATLAAARSPIPQAAIRKAIQEATSPDDLGERLAEVYLGNDPDEFRSILEQALFAADVMGYAHTQDQSDLPTGKPAAKASEDPAAAPTFHLSATIQMPESAFAAGQPAPVTIENHIHVPEQAAPQVTVEAPSVTVENNVSPTPITNVVKASAAQVVVQHPTRAVQKVERDPDTLEVTQTVTDYEIKQGKAK